MIDKIYEKLCKAEIKSTEQYNKSLGLMDENEKIMGTTPRKNIDLIQILSNIGLIDKTEENYEILRNFYDYLFKLGIEIGINQGKKLTISAIQKNMIEFDKIMDVNCEELTSFDLKPTYVYDMIDDMNNK